MDKLKLRIIDENTGEIIPVNKRKSDLKEYVLSLPEVKKADLLSKANWLRKLAGDIEKNIQDYVKGLQLEFDEDNKAMWQDFKLSKISVKRFDQDKFEREGTEIEKQIILKAEKIREKYARPSSYIRF